MPVSQTSRLTAIWGVGVLLTLLGGLYVIRSIGKKACANLGAAIAAAAFLLIISAGIFSTVPLFQLSIFVLGIGGGLMTVSNLSFMLEMTVPQAAGLYMGAWGVANFAGQAVGNIVSGLIRDVAFLVSGNVSVGYIIVFGLEMFGLILAIVLFREISVSKFREDAKQHLYSGVA